MATTDADKQQLEGTDATTAVGGAATATAADTAAANNKHSSSPRAEDAAGCAATPTLSSASSKKLLLCRRFKDAAGGALRNFNSLPLFVYATSASTHATSADGVGVSKEATAAAAAAAATNKNDTYDLALLCNSNANNRVAGVGGLGVMDCLPLSSNSHLHHALMAASPNAAASGVVAVGNGGAVLPLGGAVAVIGATGGLAYPHHLHLSHQTHPHLVSHHSPYTNNYPLHHSGSHHHIHSDQTKSLQELQHEVGALLEFRDLVIETFPDLKHKMASMSSSTSAASSAVGGGGSVSTAPVSATNTLTGGASSLASRREWEPGIRIKRKLSQKEPSTSAGNAATAAAASAAGNAGVAGELSSTSLTRSRSNSHSGKKEPKSGENNNGSVVQDSGFSTETSSSKEGHSASSSNGAMTGPHALNRLSCPESDDELLNLLDVIHRKSNRLREEMDQLQNYERQNLRGNQEEAANAAAALSKSNSGGSSTTSGLTPKTFREHVERLNKEDIKQLRRERDRLLDKLAEMEAETLTGRIKAAKMSDQVEELINVKKDLEEQLKLAMAQKLELSSRVQLLQQQQQLQSKSSSSQSETSSQRNFLTSATTVLSTGSAASSHHLESALVPASMSATTAATTTVPLPTRRQNTFQPVVVEQHDDSNINFAFHQSAGSDNKQQQQPLGRLDGIVSTPGGRSSKLRAADSRRFTAILLETSVIELQRHLLTLTVQNQVLMQKLEQASKSKTNLAKRLDKSKEDVEDLRFQLEEKNIELEGTKAQLRVLESRIHSVTPSSGAATNSYLHSQNDYETNRSSASTTLMLSRRGPMNDVAHQYSDMRSATPISQTSQLPPNVTQISTPSMKAMVHLPMDELQQHSSSTESAHEHELQQHELPQALIGRLMSTSVGGMSPFEQQRLPSPRGQQSTATSGAKRFSVSGGGSGAATKPSKIPLPGSKAASYFAGKPPSGRPSTAGRSPPSHASSRSSLSRSTGNLLYSKSPNSLKRADSAQSIRKENNNSNNNNSSSFSTTTNSSRSSTSSSIPMATTPYATTTSKSPGAAPTIPSMRVLQNSPLPKLKRESLTSRVRHLDSLSRHNHNANDAAATTPSTTPVSNNSTCSPTALERSYMVSSTPRPGSITAHMNAAMRKDLQLSASSVQPYVRRSTTAAASAATNGTGRRLSSASTISARVTGGRSNLEHSSSGIEHSSNGSGSSSAAVNGVNGASDSDSGKNSIFYYIKPTAVFLEDDIRAHNCRPTPKPVPAPANQWPRKSEIFGGAPAGMHSAAGSVVALQSTDFQNPYFNMCYSPQYSDYELEAAAAEMVLSEKAYFSLSAQNSLRSSSGQGSDKLLVTFDYGYSESLEAEMSLYYDEGEMSDDVFEEHAARNVYAIAEEEPEEVARNLKSSHDEKIWRRATESAPKAKAIEDDAVPFKVHHVKHEFSDNVDSFMSSFTEYDVDDYEDEQAEADVSIESVALEQRWLAQRNVCCTDEETNVGEDVEEDEEEQFYDSIECA